MPYKPASMQCNCDTSLADPRVDVAKWVTKWHGTWWLSREWWRIGLTVWPCLRGTVYQFRFLLLRVGVYRPRRENVSK